MLVKMKDLYDQLKKLNIEIDLVAGEAGLSNMVSWFHVVEGLDIITFLEGQEIVMTTGIALKEKNVKLIDVVKASLQHGASAMIVNIGPYIESIDDETIAFCKENQFPLFVCPWNVYMANVIKIITQEILRHQEKQNELITCLKNAICFPNQQELYIPGLQRYDYEIEWKYCISIMKVIDRKTNQTVSKEELKTLRMRLENTLAFLSPHSLTFRLHDDIVICFADQSENSIRMNINRVIENMSLRVRKKYKLYIGIGRNTLSIRCLNKTYAIALKVAKLQQKLDRPYEVLSYTDMGISKLFLAMDDTEIMKEYYHQMLAELVRYDELNHTDYVDFLDVFFEEGCKASSVAERLYIHRNSVNYKLKKIETILDCDLNDFQTRASIMVALKLRWLL